MPPPAEVVLRVAPRHDEDGYAQNLLGLSEATRTFERDPANRYSYCIRTTATYECVSYDRAGSLRKKRVSAQAHGTGFAYQQKDGDTYLLTNFHVAEWPAVTDGHHSAGDVPSGCKKVSDSLKIVDDEHDDYAADDIPLTRVVEDQALDAAVLKTHTSLRTMPYRIGHSGQLKAGDSVTVQGFPLGAFRAVTHGQVINPVDHDHDGDWEHDDFIIDAALSSGNSGSPVLAVSQRTGEYELVGLFHAEYVEGHGLNAVIAIDQLRDLMFTLKRPARDAQADHRPGAQLRAEFVQAVSRPDFVPYLTLGSLTIGVRAVGDALVYEVFTGSFPSDARRVALLVDQPTASGFGQLETVWSISDKGFSSHDGTRLDADGQAHLADFMRRLHEVSATEVRIRALRSRAASSRQAQEDLDREVRLAGRRASTDSDLVQSLTDLVDGLDGSDEDSVPYEGVYAQLVTPPAGARHESELPAPSLAPPGSAPAPAQQASAIAAPPLAKPTAPVAH